MGLAYSEKYFNAWHSTTWKKIGPIMGAPNVDKIMYRNIARGSCIITSRYLIAFENKAQFLMALQ